MDRENTRALRTLAIGHGLYFAATGVWPLLHMRSFERVTGPKTDKWLVQTVGTLVGVIGATLVSAAIRRSITAETAGLAVGAAVGLGIVDTVFSARRRISPIYLADAAVEAVLVAAWLRQLNHSPTT